MKGDEGKQTTCPDGYNQCIRAWNEMDDKITFISQCGTEAKCKERKDACDKSGEGKCAISCCDTDLCNAGSPVSFNVFLVAVCSTLGLALLK